MSWIGCRRGRCKSPETPAATFKRRLGAVRVALRFDEPGSGELWMQWYQGSEDLVERMQLGMALLEVSQWVGPLFKPMVSSARPC